MVQSCNQASNESTRRLRGGLAMGIRSPESVRNIPSCVAKRSEKIKHQKNPRTHQLRRQRRIKLLFAKRSRPEAISWHGGNSSPSENLSSLISCLIGGQGQCFLGVAKACIWSSFGVLQLGQRDERLGFNHNKQKKYKSSRGPRTERYNT